MSLRAVIDVLASVVMLVSAGLALAQEPFAAPPREKSSAGEPASLHAGAMRFTRISVQDPGINNIEAVSFLIPAG